MLHIVLPRQQKGDLQKGERREDQKNRAVAQPRGGLAPLLSAFCSSIFSGRAAVPRASGGRARCALRPARLSRAPSRRGRGTPSTRDRPFLQAIPPCVPTRAIHRLVRVLAVPSRVCFPRSSCTLLPCECPSSGRLRAHGETGCRASP